MLSFHIATEPAAINHNKGERERPICNTTLSSKDSGMPHLLPLMLNSTSLPDNVHERIRPWTSPWLHTVSMKAYKSGNGEGPYVGASEPATPLSLE